MVYICDIVMMYTWVAGAPAPQRTPFNGTNYAEPLPPKEVYFTLPQERNEHNSEGKNKTKNKKIMPCAHTCIYIPV